MIRRLILTAFLACALLALPGAALASGDNGAVAVNTQDGSSLFRFVFDIKRDADAVVDNQNAAVAVSQCNDCTTVAIAIQLVLVTGDPTTVTPTNVAVALNESCNLCQTMALAYQVVIGTGGPVRFTHDGEREIHAIRKELADLERSGLPLDELKTRVDALVLRLKQVVATQLVPAGNGGEGDGGSGETTGTSTEPATTTEPGTTGSTPTTTLSDTTATDTTSTATSTEPTTTDGTTTVTP